MKTSILIVLLSVFNPHSTLDLTKVRDAFERASKDEQIAKQLLYKADQEAPNSIVMLGYKGAATMMLAKFQYNPFSKLEYFTNGKLLLEKAISQDAGNIELIFIRFSVQSYAPAFLKYNKNLSKDKHFLLSTIFDISDKDLQMRISRFLKSSSLLSTSERNNLPL